MFVSSGDEVEDSSTRLPEAVPPRGYGDLFHGGPQPHDVQRDSATAREQGCTGTG